METPLLCGLLSLGHLCGPASLILLPTNPDFKAHSMHNPPLFLISCELEVCNVKTINNHLNTWSPSREYILGRVHSSQRELEVDFLRVCTFPTFFLF